MHRAVSLTCVALSGAVTSLLTLIFKERKGRDATIDGSLKTGRAYAPPLCLTDYYMTSTCYNIFLLSVYNNPSVYRLVWRGHAKLRIA